MPANVYLGVPHKRSAPQTYTKGLITMIYMTNLRKKKHCPVNSFVLLYLEGHKQYSNHIWEDLYRPVLVNHVFPTFRGTLKLASQAMKS